DKGVNCIVQETISQTSPGQFIEGLVAIRAFLAERLEQESEFVFRLEKGSAYSVLQPTGQRVPATFLPDKSSFCLFIGRFKPKRFGQSLKQFTHLGLGNNPCISSTFEYTAAFSEGPYRSSGLTVSPQNRDSPATLP